MEKRHKEMVNGLGDGIKESLVDIDALSDEERLEMFHKFLQEQAKDKASWKKVMAEGERLKFPKFSVMALTDWAFTPDMVAEVAAMKKLFHPFLQAKKAKKEFIGGVEMSIGMHSLFDFTSEILEKLYKKGYFDEETIVAWKEKGPTKKFVKKKTSTKIHAQAEKFFAWLAEHKDDPLDEDEESDDDDDDDAAGDLEIGFSDSIDLNDNGPNGSAEAPAVEEDEGNESDDFDIDDI